MEPKKNSYPIFEANQVLANDHLNQVFTYLDKQERLTRANLIGIGIVCGLELEFDEKNVTIQLSKGCGVTSEGYLIVEPQEQTLDSYRGYELPTNLAYAPLSGKSLWELLPQGSPEAQAVNAKKLTAFPPPLKDMAVVLFLELRNDKLRNCSPNNCNDKGAEVTVTVRRLLIAQKDLKDILAAAHELSSTLTSTELEATLTARLQLPEIRLPRYNVPHSTLATSEEVLRGFSEALRTSDFVKTIFDALSKAHNAFLPLLQDLYPNDPFPTLKQSTAFRFLLDTTTPAAGQVRFLPYYYDLFDDVLNGFEELRRLGLELLCACCPSEKLFPRHLMLGAAIAATGTEIYRQPFLASAALSNCEEKTKDLRQLFQRLVALLKRFTITPLPSASPSTNIPDAQIRITPSQLAPVALSTKCIPYYYTQKGNAPTDNSAEAAKPLYELWSPGKTRRNRAKHNLSYRADEYATEPFVRQPLRYDLEPYNFLRIEGHLGKNYDTVLKTLLALKAQFRLPIEIVALRTSAVNENITVDLSQEECWFQDLEMQYRVQREQLRCFLCKEMQYFYDPPLPNPATDTGKSYPPQEPLLTQCAPNFRVKPGTLGDEFEEQYKLVGKRPYLDLDVWKLETAKANIIKVTLWHLLYYMSKLAEILPEELGTVKFVEVENRYADLVTVASLLERNRKAGLKDFPDATSLLSWEEIDDRIEAILYTCRLDAFKAIRDEYVRRVREVKQKQFFSFFLARHPGIQHKAGVPLGGTFILVYHDTPKPSQTDAKTAAGNDQFTVMKIRQILGETSSDADEQSRLNKVAELIKNKVSASAPAEASNVAESSFVSAVKPLLDGTVIADFFLPYLCCSDCAPVQFVLPPPPLIVTLELGCTGNNGAELMVTVQNGSAPFMYQFGNQLFQPLPSKLTLPVGTHTLVFRDSLGAKSDPQTVIVLEAVSISTTTLPGVVTNTNYNQTLTATGGTAPYTFSLSGGALPNGLTLSSNGVLSGTPPTAGAFEFTVQVTDASANKCTGTRKYTINVCAPPVISTHPASQSITAGQSVPLTVVASGQELSYQWRKGEIPISGATNSSYTIPKFTRNEEGRYDVVVTNACGTATSNPATLTAKCPPITLTPSTLPDGAVNTSYNQKVTAVPADGGYTYAVTTGALPSGLKLDTTTGTITGIPLAGGTTNFTITATDANACSGAQNYSITIQAPCSYIINPTSQPFSASGGTGVVTVTTTPGCEWEVKSNALWIKVTSADSGTGSGAVNYEVAANTSGNPRTSSITIAGHHIIIEQTAEGQTQCPIIEAFNPPREGVGRSVVILGQHFTGVNAVLFFKKVNASFTIDSDKQITTKVPVGALTGPITVSKPGCTDAVSQEFTVIPGNPPGGIVPHHEPLPTPEPKAIAEQPPAKKKATPKKPGKTKSRRSGAQRQK